MEPKELGLRLAFQLCLILIVRDVSHLSYCIHSIPDSLSYRYDNLSGRADSFCALSLINSVELFLAGDETERLH